MHDWRNRVKVGIYCDSEINGGHEEMLKRFVLALIATANIEALTIFVPIANPELHGFVGELAQEHSKVQRIELSYTSESIRGNAVALLNMIRDTAAKLRTAKPSKLLIAQGTIVSGLAGLLAARYAGIPAISYLPLIDEAPAEAGLTGKLKWMVKRVLYRVPNEYVTLNDHLRARLHELAPLTRASVVENYVDDRFSKSTLTRHQAREALGLPDDGTTIVSHIGRLDCKQKRQDFLLEAIERHADAFRHTLVLIVGDGPDAQRYAEMIDASPILSACVRMVGAKDDVLPYIVASDTLVLPSAFEGVPLVMIEAVLAERPIVASRVSALEAYLPNDLLFAPDDHDAFVERIFAARDVPLQTLAKEFRRRFSREAFETRAQRVMLASGESNSPYDSTNAQHDRG
jgi:glycosyltransferase involved in cell wall biosynthesis